MADSTEGIRMALVGAINADPGSREALEAKHGQVWNTEELKKDFTVSWFNAPFVGVVQKVTGKKGSLTFQHSPRFYFVFIEEK